MLYERLAHSLIGTPLQGPAERLRGLRQAWSRRKHPEQDEISREGERAKAFVKATVVDGMNCLDVGCHLGSVLDQEAVRVLVAEFHKSLPSMDLRRLSLIGTVPLVARTYVDQR